jgi:Arylsulfatase A and related enzymes
MAQTRRQFISAAAGLTAVSASAQAERKWNLLIITNDQHRADCLGCYGNPVIRTPAVDRLAAHGVRFENYFVHAPQCVPSRVSMHTGRYPHTHRVPTNAYLLPESEQTIAKILNARGYRTACIGEMPFAPRSYTGGFQQVLANNQDYDKFLAGHGLKFPPAEGRFQAAPAPWTDDLDETAFFANHAREFLRSTRDAPFFLHVNFRRPHHPFNPPAPYDTMYLGANFPPSHKREGEMANKPSQQKAALENSVGFDLRTMTPAELDRVKAYYYGMITENDKYIGAILEELKTSGLEDRTLVIFNADHGEMLGDHGLLFKGSYMYDAVVRVPCIMRAPGKLPSGAVVNALVEEVDVLPTILDVLGAPIPSCVQGKSLVALANNPSSKHKQAVFSEFPTIRMARTKEWKLVHYVKARQGELYHLTEDPYELTNLFDDPKHAGARADMEALLFDWLVGSQDPLLAPVRDPEEPGN